MEKGRRCCGARTMNSTRSAVRCAYSVNPGNAVDRALGRPRVAAHGRGHTRQQLGGRAWCGGAPWWCTACSIPCGIAVMHAIIAGRQAALDAISTTAVDCLKRCNRRVTTTANRPSVAPPTSVCTSNAFYPQRDRARDGLRTTRGGAEDLWRREAGAARREQRTRPDPARGGRTRSARAVPRRLSRPGELQWSGTRARTGGSSRAEAHGAERLDGARRVPCRAASRSCTPSSPDAQQRTTRSARPRSMPSERTTGA